MITAINHVCVHIRTSVEDANFQREGGGGVSNNFIVYNIIWVNLCLLGTGIRNLDVVD